MEKENNRLPIYDYVYDPVEDGGKPSQLFRYTLVPQGAMLADYVMFSKNSAAEQIDFKVQNEERRLIMGATLIPGMQVKRITKKLGEHYARFTPKLIRDIGNDFLLNENIHQFALTHRGETIPKEKMQVSEIWYKEGKYDKSQNFGFDYPDGTQLFTAYVPDTETWEDIKKNGLKGFSVEAYLNAIEAQNFEAEIDFQKNDTIYPTQDIIQTLLMDNNTNKDTGKNSNSSNSPQNQTQELIDKLSKDLSEKLIKDLTEHFSVLSKDNKPDTGNGSANPNSQTDNKTTQNTSTPSGEKDNTDMLKNLFTDLNTRLTNIEASIQTQNDNFTKMSVEVGTLKERTTGNINLNKTDVGNSTYKKPVTDDEKMAEFASYFSSNGK